jgi:hypothetical protein
VADGSLSPNRQGVARFQVPELDGAACSQAVI